MTDKEREEKTTTSSFTDTDTDSDTEPEVESFHDALENLTLGGDKAEITCDHIVTSSGDNQNDNETEATDAGCLETQNDDSMSAKTQDAEENYRMTDSDNDDAGEVTVDEQAILDRESQMTLEERQVGGCCSSSSHCSSALCNSQPMYVARVLSSFGRSQVVGGVARGVGDNKT